MTYSIVYRSGGTHNCTWQRVMNSYADVASANAKAAEIERMGYKALVTPYATLRAIGMPIGWTADSVDYDRDTVVYEMDRTVHVKKWTPAQERAA
jgi:hypothetical protein